MAKHESEHRCRRWWNEGMECPFKALEEHEEDDGEEEPGDLGDAVAAGKVSVRSAVARARVPAVAKAKAEEPVRVVSGSNAVSAVALTALVATAAHLATGRKGPGKGTFKAAELLAAKTAGRFTNPRGAPAGGGFHFQVQDFKKGVLRRKVSRAQQGPGQAPASGGV